MQEQELYNEAVEVLSRVGVETDEKVGIPPFIVTIFSSWFIKSLKKLGCENKQVVIDAATKAINAIVKNPMVAAMCLQVITTAVEAFCASDILV